MKTKFDNPYNKVEELVNRAKVKMRPFLISAYMNVEYVRGNQNLRVNKDLSIVKIDNKSSVYMERKVFNRMSPIYLSRLGLLSANMPVPGFKQTGSSPGRFIDYTEGNRFISDFLIDSNFKNTFHNPVAIRADLHGLVWIKTGINWNHGKQVGTYDVTVKQEGKEDKKVTQKFYEGRPWIEICSMDEIFVDNYFQGAGGEITELVHRRLFTTEYIKARWGIDADEDINDIGGNGRYNLTGSSRQDINGTRKEGDTRYAYVYEYYHKANAEYPNGVFFVIINKKLVTKILPLPYENDKEKKRVIPFDFVKIMDLPNYLVGPTIYNQIIPIQDTYNSVKNRVLEYINRIGISQFYAWEGSLVDKKSLSNRPGEIFMIRRNAKQPQPVIQDKLGTEFINYLITLENDMLVTAGLSPITAHGQAKSAMRTDGVVDRITESDQNKLEHAIDNISQSYTKIFKKILYLEKMRERILIEQVGLMSAPLVDQNFTKYKLEEVDVEQLQIVNRDFLMKNDQYIDSKFKQAQALGVFTPQSGLTYIQKVHIMEKLHLGSILETLDPVEVQTNQIVREEHEEIELGILPEVEEWHFHQQHIYEHNLYRQSPIMRKWRKFDNKKYKLMLEQLDSHIQEHQKFVQNKQNDMGQAFQSFGQKGQQPNQQQRPQPS